VDSADRAAAAANPNTTGPEWKHMFKVSPTSNLDTTGREWTNEPTDTRTRAHLPKSLSEQKTADPVWTRKSFCTFITFHKLIQVAITSAVIQENIFKYK
jgi:hypothetical protein